MPHVNSIDVRDRLIAEFAAEFPHPAALLTAAFPRLVRSARFYGQTDDDIDSLCWLSVVKASARFDESLGFSKSTYYAKVMRFDLMNVIKREDRAAPIRGYGFGSDGGSDFATPDLLETVACRRDFESEIDTQDEVRRVFGVCERGLTSELRNALYGYYGVGGRVSGSAAVPGASRHVVARMREAAVGSVRRKLGVALSATADKPTTTEDGR